MPRLTELLAACRPAPGWQGNPQDVDISGITSDSRQVMPGTLFVALKGDKADGAEFIPDAIRKGAVAVVCGNHTDIGSLVVGAPVLRTPNPRLALAQMAAAFYPRQPATIVAVTGTDGKTSTADFTRQLWALMGYKTASIGTLGTIREKGQELYPGTHTTPDPMSLHKMLQELHDAGYTHIAMEASSHGLDQYRLHGVRIKAAAYTNLTRDHLDYHKTEEAYFTAKAKLFSEFPLETAVINADDKRYPALWELCRARGCRATAFGHKGKELAIQSLKPHATGLSAAVSLEGEPVALDIPLVGAFQLMNILAAVGLLAASGEDAKQALLMASRLKGVPGRLEHVATLKNGAAVYIDYAHTPAALANILKTLRPHTQHKLHVVFGCGGDRDAGKRPEMGRAASELADVATVTDDNPRSEDPAAIRAAIMAAAPRAKEIGDRRQAIRFALGQLNAGDILVIAGKGHEKTQTIGKNVLPFDDAQVARELVKELG